MSAVLSFLIRISIEFYAPLINRNISDIMPALLGCKTSGFLPTVFVLSYCTVKTVEADVAHIRYR